ncbi:MAG: hypothetical protein AAF804_11390 [Bacteroidota bacterium]
MKYSVFALWLSCLTIGNLCLQAQDSGTKHSSSSIYTSARFAYQLPINVSGGNGFPSLNSGSPMWELLYQRSMWQYKWEQIYTSWQVGMVSFVQRWSLAAGIKATYVWRENHQFDAGARLLLPVLDFSNGQGDSPWTNPIAFFTDANANARYGSPLIVDFGYQYYPKGNPYFLRVTFGNWVNVGLGIGYEFGREGD